MDPGYGYKGAPAGWHIGTKRWDSSEVILWHEHLSAGCVERRVQP